ncbi:MAG: Ig-like domain-containing protein, partial [Candidatus Thiodiazotropha sp.]
MQTSFFLMFVLAACGGGDAETPWDGTGTTTGDTATATYTLGNGAGSNFDSGKLRVSVTSLSAGGTTSVIVTVADRTGNLYPDDLDIIFSSQCVVNGQATIESPVTATAGMATTTYEAQGCTGSDEITAYATIDGVTVTATGYVTVAASTLGSMQFVSAEPANIGLKGFGLVETSDVTFRVLDTNSNPVSGQLVNFALNTTVGGATLINSSATSDVNGLVTATVNSGTIPTSVRITATLVANSALSTQSDGVTISTGISDQNSFSLALSNHSPEAWNTDGEVVTASVYAADHFNNPVPDGTAIYFTTEGGQMESQCLTAAGRCSVKWTSSNPRPDNGRVTVLATMLG